MPDHRLLGLLPALALLALPAIADASTVSRSVEPQFSPPVTVLTFTGSGGERNDVTVERRGESFVFTDRAATLKAGRGCVSETTHRARCLPPSVPLTVWVRGTGGDDRIAIEGTDLEHGHSGKTLIYADGGDGRDVVTGPDDTSIEPVDLGGGAGADVVRAGGAAAIISGGPGRDVLRGGAGDDVIDGDSLHGDVLNSGAVPNRRVPENASPAADDIDGGAGSDWIDYSLRSDARVRVDLARDAGAEGDVLRSVENAEAGARGGVLRGDEGPNELVGADDPDVRDRLEGRGGDDLLDGRIDSESAFEPGKFPRDALVGGAGRDTIIEPGSGSSCGSGEDVLRYDFFSPQTPSLAGCEWRWNFRSRFKYRVGSARVRGGRLLVDIAVHTRNASAFRLQAGREVTRTDVRVPAGAPDRLVTLSAPVRGTLGAGKLVTLRIIGTGEGVSLADQSSDVQDIVERIR